MNRIRTGVVVAGYILCAILGLVSKLHIEKPKPIIVKAPTEAQMKEQFEHERAERVREKAIQKAVLAARAVYRQNGCKDVYSDLTGRTAYEYRISARLLAAVVFVESSCRPTARSDRNSIGLMQINQRVWGHGERLTDPEFNIRLGTMILSSYVHRYGLVEGLHHYNGLGDPSNSYAERVLGVGKISWRS